MLASILELDPRSGGEIADSAGDQNLAGAGLRTDARSEVDRDPTDIVASGAAQ